MNMAKKLIALAMAVLVGAQLASCGKETSDEFNYSKGLDKNGYFEGIKATDYVTLPTYKGIEIDASVLEVTDEALQKQIDIVLSDYTTYEKITNRAVKDGDSVNIDYVGKVNGTEFEGGNTGGYGTDVIIGVSDYIDDFLEQIIGHKPGETFDIEVTFPEDYGVEDLNGKDATFTTTVNHINGDPIKPELDETVAADYGFASVDEMIADIKNWIIGSQQFKVFNDLLLSAEIKEIPQVVMDYVVDFDLYQYKYSADIYGVTIEEFLVDYLGHESKQAYLDANAAMYEENARMYLAAQAIAELEGIKATTDDLYAAGYNEYSIDMYGEPYVKQMVMFQNILPAFIMENAVTK